MAVTNIQSFAGQVEIASNLDVGNSNLYVNTQTSNVGVGTSTPAFSLDIVGDINFTGTIYREGSILYTSPWTKVGNDLSYTSGNVLVTGSSSSNPVFLVNEDTHTVGINTNITTQPQKLTTRAGGISIRDNGNITYSKSSKINPYWDKTITKKQELVASDNDSGDNFGREVAISKNSSYVVVGATEWDSPSVTNKGAVYAFVHNGSSWVEEQTITSSATVDESFGSGVAVSEDGSYIAVSAYNWNVNLGAIYVFNHNGSSWVEQQRLTASDGESFGLLGIRGVSISDDGSKIATSSYFNNNGEGSVYVFSRTNSSWSEEAILVGSDITPGDFFGWSVAISGNGSYVVGCSSNWDGPGPIPNQGAAYVFSYNGSSWSEQQILTTSDAGSDDQIGESVSISSDGSYIMIGTPKWDGENDDRNSTGASYIFQNNGSSWVEQELKLVGSLVSLNSGDSFGEDVAISSDGVIAVSGVPNANSGAGRVSISYRIGEGNFAWIPNQASLNESSTSDFGRSVSVSDNGTIVVGTDSQKVFIYESGPKYLEVNNPIEANGTVLSFTGQHICVGDGPMEYGLVVSANKNKYVNLNGPLTTGGDAIRSSESLPVVSLSQVANDKTVFGVVDHLESRGTSRRQTLGAAVASSSKELGDDRVVVNSLGEGAIWAINTNGNIGSGDFLTTSNVSGYAQRQDTPILHSYTVAKSTMDCNFDPEDIPIQIIKRDQEGNNILDENRKLQWEDTENIEKAYKIRYLTQDGTQTDEANAVWKAAYIGCTYHCG
jgi:hypothetical protein